MAAAKKKTAPKQVRDRVTARTVLDECLKRIEALERPCDSLAKSMDAAIKGTSDALRDGALGIARELPSEFACGEKVYVRFGDVMVPGRVIGIGFNDVQVTYTVAPAADGPLIHDVWSGFVLPRSERHATAGESFVNQAMPCGAEKRA